jgi:hypothetical protein
MQIDEDDTTCPIFSNAKYPEIKGRSTGFGAGRANLGTTFIQCAKLENSRREICRIARPALTTGNTQPVISDT